MRVVLIFSNDEGTLNMKQEFTVEFLKQILKDQPLALLEQIERTEKQFKMPQSPIKYDYSDATAYVII